MKKIKSVVILGPTGVGKSSLGIVIAQKFNGEIVSVDSRQMYRDIDIGTAKPSSEELKLVPHHMISVYPLDREVSAADYVKDASKIIKEIDERGKLPIIVGGTGFYFDFLLNGISNIPSRNSELRDRMENIISKRNGIQKLYNLLKKVDSNRAARLTTNDRVRIIRALEVYLISGKPMSYFEKIKKVPIINLEVIQLGLTMDRKLLYNAIDRRVDKMVEMGLFNEIKKLITSEINSKRLLTTIGYSEVLSYFDGEITENECISLIKRNSRRYAKRQFTWLRKIKELNWIDVNRDNYIADVIKLVDEFIEG